VPGAAPSGDDLLRALEALANPHRLRILASLAGGRNYVSQLARDLQISRPLLHMHLQRLEGARLIASAHEVSEDGKAMRYVEVTPFAFSLTPEAIAQAVRSLSDGPIGAPPSGHNEDGELR
jgi:DNA-binding transcriptional ArsR family regulator